MIPQPTADDLARDAERDYKWLLANDGGPMAFCYLRLFKAAEKRAETAEKIIKQTPSMDMIRRLEIAEEHCRNHHLELCETCIANESARIAAERERDIALEAVGKWARVGHPIMDAIEGTPLGSMGTDPEPFVRRIKELKEAERERDELQGRLIAALERNTNLQATLNLHESPNVTVCLEEWELMLRERDEARAEIERLKDECAAACKRHEVTATLSSRRGVENSELKDENARLRSLLERAMESIEHGIESDHELEAEHSKHDKVILADINAALAAKGVER